MKKLLIFSLLTSCSLFNEFPKPVIDGTRAIWDSVNIQYTNIIEIISLYEKHNKAAVTQHYYYVYQKRMDVEIPNDQQLTKLIEERDILIKKAYDAIDKKVEEMTKVIENNFIIQKKLVSSVYNYMSTSPLDINNIQLLVEQLESIK